jgi:HSP20 family protein
MPTCQVIDQMYKPYDDMLEDMEHEMRRITDDILLQMFRVSSMSGEVWAPRADVYETADAVVIKVCVAGLEPNQMDLTLSADSKFLTLRGVRVEQDEDKAERTRYHQLEVYYGPFERVVLLPPDVPIDRDGLAATYKDGFLKITLPKVRKAKAIKVQVEEPDSGERA